MYVVILFCTLEPNDTSHHVTNTEVCVRILAKDSIQEIDPDVAYNMQIPSIKPLYTLIPHLETVAEEKIVGREW